MTTVDESVPAAPPRRVVVAPPRAVGSRARRPALPPAHPSDEPRRRAVEKATEYAASTANEAVSPTTDIRHVMQVFIIGLVVASIFAAKGLVHSGKGMDLGAERTIVLAISEPLQAGTQALGITTPWDTAERGLGKSTDLGADPLLSSAPSPTVPTSPTAPKPRPLKPVHAPPLPPIKRPTVSRPLRLLVTGDSLTEYLAPQLVDEATQVGPVTGHADTHYGTGIVRPDFVDWSVVARQQVAEYHPQAVVVFMGGNDDQNMTMANGEIIDAGTPRWTIEYARRVAVCMRIWSQGGRARVYWLSMPPARSDSWSAVNHQINVAIQRAAALVSRTRYLDILGPVTNHGKYADFVSVGGQPTLVRTPDGIHFNSTGSDMVSHEVLRVLTHDWRLGVRHRVSPTPTKTRKTTST